MPSPLSVFPRKKRAGEKIAMISLYDAPSAKIACDAGVDALLVGDSLGNVILGHDTTVSVTMEDMLRHTAAVVRGVKSSSRSEVPVVADLPFGTASNPESALHHAVQLMRAGAHAVKFETPARMGRFPEEQIVGHLVSQGVPVMGHIGFTPQSSLVFEKVVQGRTWDETRAVGNALYGLKDCFALVLEAVTEELTHEIGGKTDVPIIGIGAGAECDGQILVWNDLVGLTPKTPKFVKKYAPTHEIWTGAAAAYVAEVRGGSFPSAEQSYRLTPEERAEWTEHRRQWMELRSGLGTDHAGDESGVENPYRREATEGTQEVSDLSRGDRAFLEELERFWRGL